MDESMTTSTLDAALTAYALPEDAVPGVSDAWDAAFADLALLVPESETDALTRLQPALAAWTDLAVDTVVPRADGSIVVHVEGETHDGEGWSYASDHITLTGDAAREFLEARENTDTLRRLRNLHHDAGRYASGELPIWWLLAEPAIQRRHADAARAHKNANSAVERLTEHLRLIDQMQDAIDQHTPLTDAQEKEYPFASGYARGVKPLDMPGENWNDKRVVRTSHISQTASDLAKHTPALAVLQAAVDEAHALPAGALRDFLVGEREPHFYDSTEGTGRRKRTVKRSFIPVSDLVRDHRSVLDQHTRATAERDDQVKRLGVLRREAQKALDTALVRLTDAERGEALTWAEGWTGEGTPPAPLATVSEW